MKAKLTLRVLSLLLAYPNAELRNALPELSDALRQEGALLPARRAELDALMQQLGTMNPFDAEARYVDTFDRGRSTSLHLFEHVHGDSRERGPALVDLQQTYHAAGLLMHEHELPDHLAVLLEFASTQPFATARELIGETAHIVNAVFSALRQRGSPYAAVLGAVLELAGRKAEPVAVVADLPIDEAWAEPPAFDGGSTAGQAQPQPIHIVRRQKASVPG